MGTSQFNPLESLDHARERFAASRDFTIAIEEELAIIDPATHGMVNRFEDLKARMDLTSAAPDVAGELIASEIEIKSGKSLDFAAAASALRSHRRTLIAEAEALGLAVSAQGNHPWAPWQDQRIIDTPHYRLRDELLGYVAWRNNTFGIHVHVGINGADRAMAVTNAMRSVLPELLAVSAASPWADGVHTKLRSTRTQIFTRMFPRCGIPDVFHGWEDYDRYVRLLVETRSITDHTEIWWSVRPHQSFGTVEVRICDAMPDIDHTIAVAALQVALVARFARMVDEDEPLPLPAGRLLEENLWRAIRWGLSGELIDIEAGRSIPAPERIQSLLALCAEDAAALGLGPYLAPLQELLDEGDNATVWSRRLEQGEDLRTVYADVVQTTRASALRDAPQIAG